MIRKIVITGGPCGGKTAALEKIAKHFTEKGFTVLTVPETATELISGGVSVNSLGSSVEFQKCIMSLQLKKEEVFLDALKVMNKEKILVICDRGALDSRAYMTQEEFEEGLSFIGKTEEELLKAYDAVFHMVTAANGAECFYTTDNNCTRTETPEKAIQLDKKIISAWSKHKYFRQIDNSTDFNGKVERLIRKTEIFLNKN